MTNRHVPVVTDGSPSAFLDRLPHLAGLSVFHLPSLRTVEDLVTWQAEGPELMGEVAEWCQDTNWTGQVWINRSDAPAMMSVAIEASVDAVMFALRWSDLIGSQHRYAA